MPRAIKVLFLTTMRSRFSVALRGFRAAAATVKPSTSALGLLGGSVLSRTLHEGCQETQLNKLLGRGNVTEGLRHCCAVLFRGHIGHALQRQQSELGLAAPSVGTHQRSTKGFSNGLKKGV